MFAQGWVEDVKFSAPDSLADQVFGNQVAVDGDIAVIGAPSATNADSIQGGLVYVYIYDNASSSWIKKSILSLASYHYKADNEFGQSVAIYDHTVVVGTPQKYNSVYRAGAAYIFDLPTDASSWTDTIKTYTALAASDPGKLDLFGWDVDIDNNTIVIGALQDSLSTTGVDNNGEGQGSAYIFTYDGIDWTQVAKLTGSDAILKAKFGTSVAISGDTVVVGAPHQDFDNQKNEGAVYVFVKPSTGWADITETQKLKASDKADWDQFGYDVDINGSLVLVGSPYNGVWDGSANQSKAGQAYIFEGNAGTWTEKAILRLANNDGTATSYVQAYDYLSTSVCLRGDSAILGAIQYDVSNRHDNGAIYLFNEPSGGWSGIIKGETLKITADDGATDDQYGHSLAYTNNGQEYILIGAIGDDDNGSNSGSVYFEKYWGEVNITTNPQDVDDICHGSKVQLSVKASNADSYKWQVSTDGGTNYTSLNEDSVYSGTTTDTLNIIFDDNMDGYMYQCVVSNPSGSSATSSAATISKDGINPTLILQDVNVYLDQNGDANLNLTDMVKEGTDNCAVKDTIADKTSFSCSDIGNQVTVTVTLTDQAGNQSIDSAQVTVLDTLPPTIDQYDDQLVPDDGNCSATLADYTQDVTYDDNCSSSLTVTQTPAAGTLISGTTEVTITVEDASDNSSSMKFTVSVEDATDPSLTTRDITLSLDENGEAELNIEELVESAQDDCSGLKDTTVNISSFDCSKLGDNVVELTVTDNAGNSTVKTATVTVEDTIVPSINQYDNQLVPDEGNCSATLVDYTQDVTYSDNCSSSLTVTQTPAAGTLISGTTEVTITVKDASDNSNSMKFTVSVEDATAPSLTTRDITLSLDENGEAKLNIEDLVESAQDDCSGLKDTTVNISSFDCSKLGGNVVELTVTDNAGNSTVKTATVTVEDTIPPSITCPSDITKDTDTGQTYYTVQGTELDAQGSDNCSFTLSNDLNTEESLDGVQIPTGKHTITWTVTDKAGKTATCSFDITVNTATSIENIGNSSIAIYPNPTNEKLNINFGNENVKQIKLLDLKGRVIYQTEQINKTMSINLSDIKKGMYVLQIKTDNNILTQKIIKE